VSDSTFITYSLIEIDLANIQPEQITIKDISAGLSKICRFSGQITRFYSVAQHSVILSKIVPERLKKVALLHDASEAYLQDIIKPLKNLLGESYTNLENKFEHAIFDRYGLDYDLLKEIKPYERFVYEQECKCFRQGNEEEWVKWLKNDVKMFPSFWDWRQSEVLFHTRFVELFSKEAIL
jgi:uncharacterized protein